MSVIVIGDCVVGKIYMGLVLVQLIGEWWVKIIDLFYKMLREKF